LLTKHASPRSGSHPATGQSSTAIATIPRFLSNQLPHVS